MNLVPQAPCLSKKKLGATKLERNGSEREAK